MTLALPLVLLAVLPAVAAGPDDCRPCHAELVDRYLATPMGRSFRPVSPDEEIADFNGASFDHEASGRRYEMFRRGRNLLVRRHLLDDRGRKVDMLERAVTHVMGSGERAVSYLFQTAQGRLYELPVSWYTQPRAWAMAPGYDRPNHAGFTRLVNHKCMFCHNGYPQIPPEEARVGRDADVIFPTQLPRGIDCARCHGDGDEHQRSGRAEAIVNPARLRPERSLDVCMQCHLESTTFRLPESLRRFGRPFYSYRPGEPLGDYMVHFDHAPGTGHDEKFEIVSAAYRLRQSACFQRSAAMTCLSCHNPHDRPAPEARAARYRSSCLQCHATALTADHAAHSDCVGCHMPLRRTEDVVHVAMTDHKIQRRRPPGDLLAPLREKTDAEQVYRGPVVQLYPPPDEDPDLLREVYLAIAQIKDRSNLEAGLPALEKLLRRRPVEAPEPWFELAEKLAEAGRARDAERAYRRALEADPKFPHAWNNLANLLSDRGRFEEALAAYDQAVAIVPHDPHVLVNRGLSLLDAGRFSEALFAFEAAVEANPASAEAQAHLGAALLAAGRLADAAGALRAALAIEPAHRQARHNLALLEARLAQ